MAQETGKKKQKF